MYREIAQRLGYTMLPGALVDPKQVPGRNYSVFNRELDSVAQSSAEGGASVKAVFCIDNYPTACFVETRALGDPLADSDLQRLLGQLWNQDLASVAFVCCPGTLHIIGLGKNAPREQHQLNDLVLDTHAWAAPQLLSGAVVQQRPEFFQPERRVDRDLLENILELCERLKRAGLSGSDARHLVARTVLICYLEHRGIISEDYWNAYNVGALSDLIRRRDRSRLDVLSAQLRADFNGDFMSSPLGRHDTWQSLPDSALDELGQFLSRTRLRDGQTSLWEYDFSEIPVEMISGIYETFLAAKDLEAQRGQDKGASLKAKLGAYYTPRQLALHVVSQAFEDREVIDEVVFDGACGSGILLVTAYQQILLAYEKRAGRQLTFDERRDILVRHIRGGDIDEDACRLTALSLYLALLSDLNPSDLVLLRREHRAKLPPLINKILACGPAKGDYFVEASIPFSNDATVFVSNPPWREPKVRERTAADNWAEGKWKKFIPRRNLAYAFALRCAERAMDGARVVLVLPMTGITSAGDNNLAFRQRLLQSFQLNRITNFADLRRLIFEDGRHPFVVLSMNKRPTAKGAIDLSRQWEYVVPKGDSILAMGRLPISAAARHRLSEGDFISSLPILLMRYWGNDYDVDLLMRLWRLGRISDFTKQLALGGGFHLTDGAKKPVPAWLKSMKFLDAAVFAKLAEPRPWTIADHQLESFPYDQTSKLPSPSICSGPRVLITNTAERGVVKASYSELPFAFRDAITVISGASEDANVLKFLTLYLRSTLGRYLMSLLSGSIVGERGRLYQRDLASWPLCLPETHPNPELATRCIQRATEWIDARTREESIPGELFVAQTVPDDSVSEEVDAIVFDYFMLDSNDRVYVSDFVSCALRSIQPSSRKPDSLSVPYALPASERDITQFAKDFESELNDWLGDDYSVRIDGHAVPERQIGILALSLFRRGEEPELQLPAWSSELVQTVFLQLYAQLIGAKQDWQRFDGNTRISLEESSGSKVLIAKPLAKRFWLRREAPVDADNFVRVMRGLGSKSLH